MLVCNHGSEVVVLLVLLRMAEEGLEKRDALRPMIVVAVPVVERVVSLFFGGLYKGLR